MFRPPDPSDISTSGLVCTARSNIFRRETPFKLEAWDLLCLKLWSICTIRIVRVNETLGPNSDDEQYLSDFKFVCLPHRSRLLWFIAKIIQGTQWSEWWRHGRRNIILLLPNRTSAMAQIFSRLTHWWGEADLLLSLPQKSRTIVRSGTRYRRPLIKTSSVAIRFPCCMGTAFSDGMISMFPLLDWPGRSISITG